MSEPNILAFSDLPRAWSAYQERASRLAHYVDLLEQQILDGGKVLPSAEERYATNTPRNFQTVPLFVARLVPSREFRDAAELKDEDVKNALKRDQLDEIPFDPLNTEKSGPGRDVRREAIGLMAFASSVAQPGLRVLSGGAGSGKTYLVLFTVVQLLRQWRLHGRRIPILCAAEDLAKSLPKNLKDEGAAAYRTGIDAKIMARHIVDAALGRPWFRGENRSAVRDRLNELILQGQAVVVVDGLDQAYSSCDRLAVLLQELARDVKDGVLLVARPYALTSILTETFPLHRTFETLRWREHQIRAFAACHGRPEGEALELAELCRNPATAETVAVPQLLAFVVSLLKDKKLRNVAEAKTLTRAELYDRLITSRLEAVARGNLAERVRRISEFAESEWRDSQRGVRRLRGNSAVRGPFQDLKKAGLIANILALSSEIEEAEWSHRSILEFFVARSLVNRVLKADDKTAAVQALATLGFDPACRELFRFVYGRLMTQRSDLAEAVLAELTDIGRDDGALTRLSTAQVVCLDSTNSSPAHTRSIANGRWTSGQATIWEGNRPPKVFHLLSEMQPSIICRKTVISEGLRHALVKSVKEGSWQTFRELAEAIGRIGDFKAALPMREALENGIPYKQSEYVKEVLIRIGQSDSAIHLTANMIFDRRIDYDTWKVWDDKAIRTLLDAFESYADIQQWGAALGIAESIVRVGDPEAIGPLKDALFKSVANEQWGATIGLAKSLGCFGDHEILMLLLDVFEIAVTNQEWFITGDIGRSLGWIDDSKATTSLLSALHVATTNEGWPAVAGISEALARKRVPKSAAPLREALPKVVANNQWFAAGNFAMALGYIGNSDDVTPLGACLDQAVAEEKWSDAWLFAEALGRIGDSEAQKYLQNAFNAVITKGLWFDAMDIAKALGQIGEPCGSIIDDLEIYLIVHLTDSWFQGLSEHPDPIAALQSCPEEAAFLDKSPGTAFRFYSSLVRNLPPDRPRHWHKGRWKTTAKLVIQDF